MSSLTTILPPAGNRQSSQLLTPSTQPVPLLNAPFAEVYNLASIAATLTYYYLRSSDLVSDPLSTLLQDVVPVAILQSLSCAICLPVAGSWSSENGDGNRSGKIAETGSTPGKKTGGASGTGSMRKRLGASGNPGKTSGISRSTVDSSGAVGASWQGRIMPAILSMVLAITIPPAPLALLALVLGAPLYPLSLIPHTFVLAIHVAILSVLPIFYTHGVSSSAWMDVAAAWLPFDEAGVWGGTVGTLVGGWVGAIPIALDWDREWQKWPCTVIWGAVLGWAVGKLLTSFMRFGIGSRINLSVSGDSPSLQSVVSEDLKKK